MNGTWLQLQQNSVNQLLLFNMLLFFGSFKFGFFLTYSAKEEKYDRNEYDQRKPRHIIPYKKK